MSLLLGQLCPGVVALVMFPSIGQIDMFEIYCYLIDKWFILLKRISSYYIYYIYIYIYYNYHFYRQIKNAIKMIVFALVLVLFYGISTTVSYLMTNLYIYIYIEGTSYMRQCEFEEKNDDSNPDNL